MMPHATRKVLLQNLSNGIKYGICFWNRLLNIHINICTLNINEEEFQKERIREEGCGGLEGRVPYCLPNTIMALPSSAVKCLGRQNYLSGASMLQFIPTGGKWRRPLPELHNKSNRESVRTPDHRWVPYVVHVQGERQGPCSSAQG